MKKLIAGLAAFALLFAAAPAFAQGQQSNDSEEKSKTYEFDGSHIKGEKKDPNATWYGHRDSAKFERLHRVKQSFEDEVTESGQDQALE